MLYYITGNQNKIDTAKKYLSAFGVEFEGKKLDLIEEQTDSIEKVALFKAEQAFDQIRQPLFVNDSGWSITALNGFPGPLMKYINEWFTPQDFLNLMKDRENREVFLGEVVVYKDEKQTKVFTHQIKGVVLREVKGEGISSDCVISLSDTGKSIAQCQAEGIKSHDNQTLWQDFVKWYISRATSGVAA
ncbi:hypothetical protein HY385_02575 [Candidatus Daviesbacteria bacterium]|nr:hypothetical protein [Candidatus Daviesbacteria bacterium]